ncbi:MAG: cytochrome c, partial [Rhodospirillaceae bacterium]
MFIKPLKDRKLLLVILLATLICLSYIGYRSFENVNLTEDIVLLPEDLELVALGKQVYATHCASCHGVNLEGQTNWQVRGPDGKLPAPPHDQTGHTWHHSDAHLFKLTKYGVEKMIGQKYPNN